MTGARRSPADLADRRAGRVLPAPVAHEVEAKTYRQTVDLSGEHHAALTEWRTRMAVELGRSRLTTQDVLSALVAVLLDDADVTARVVDHIRATPERRRRGTT